MPDQFGLTSVYIHVIILCIQCLHLKRVEASLMMNKNSLKVFELHKQTACHKANIHTVMLFELAIMMGGSQIYTVSKPFNVTTLLVRF